MSSAAGKINHQPCGVGAATVAALVIPANYTMLAVPSETSGPATADHWKRRKADARPDRTIED